MRRWRWPRVGARPVMVSAGAVIALALVVILLIADNGAPTMRPLSLHRPFAHQATQRSDLPAARSFAALDAINCPTGSQNLLSVSRVPVDAPPIQAAVAARTTTQASAPPAISAAAAYLFDPDTGRVLYAFNANQERAMASTTKIMTAVTALEFGSLSQMITIGPDSIAMQNGQDSVAGLKLGDKLTLCDLLYALLLPSGDDAAVAIAEGVAGTQARFVSEMNAEAALLGLWHTHYENPTGLDQNGHYTTAIDLGRLAAFAMNIPAFAQVVGTAKYTVPATADHTTYTWQTTNELLTATPTPGATNPITPYPGTTGVKTGYTGNALYCLVFSATRNGRRLIGVLLGEPDATGDTGRFTDAIALLNWGFGVS